MQDLEPITWGVSEIASRAGLSGAVKAWVSQWLSGWSLDSRCILMRSEHAACFKFENFNAVQVPWVPWVPWVSGCLRMSQGPRGYLWPMVTYFYIDCHNYMWPPGAAGKTIRVGWYPCTYPVLPNGVQLSLTARRSAGRNSTWVMATWLWLLPRARARLCSLNWPYWGCRALRGKGDQWIPGDQLCDTHVPHVP